MANNFGFQNLSMEDIRAITMVRNESLMEQIDSQNEQN
jgi:hypothetical protein